MEMKEALCVDIRFSISREELAKGREIELTDHELALAFLNFLRKDWTDDIVIEIIDVFEGNIIEP